ncbi:MAG: hypothetical protein ACRDS0_08315 [Pseudonocardiaceae bacterium]
MSDREPGSGVAVWVALRRAHQGRVATLAGHWLDSGRPVPGYVAEALEELLRGGLLTVGESDPQSCGVRRITITDAGSAHYVALWQTHNPAWSGRNERATSLGALPERPAQSPARRPRPGSNRDSDRSLWADHAVVGAHQHPADRAALPNLSGNSPTCRSPNGSE